MLTRFEEERLALFKKPLDLSSLISEVILGQPIMRGVLGFPSEVVDHKNMGRLEHFLRDRRSM